MFMRNLTIIFVFGIGIFLSLVFYKTQESFSETADFGGVSLRLEYAVTPDERERGLSGRADIPQDYGMLFAFPVSGNYGFWMKDTRIPLDIFWLDDKGQVVSIAKDVATSSYPNVFYPSVPAKYVLETKAGFANMHNITNGELLRLKTFPSVLK
jgi:uncharacterized protein